MTHVTVRRAEDVLPPVAGIFLLLLFVICVAALYFITTNIADKYAVDDSVSRHVLVGGMLLAFCALFFSFLTATLKNDIVEDYGKLEAALEVHLQDEGLIDRTVEEARGLAVEDYVVLPNSKVMVLRESATTYAVVSLTKGAIDDSGWS